MFRALEGMRRMATGSAEVQDNSAAQQRNDRHLASLNETELSAVASLLELRSENRQEPARAAGPQRLPQLQHLTLGGGEAYLGGGVAMLPPDPLLVAAAHNQPLPLWGLPTAAQLSALSALQQPSFTAQDFQPQPSLGYGNMHEMRTTGPPTPSLPGIRSMRRSNTNNAGNRSNRSSGTNNAITTSSSWGSTISGWGSSSSSSSINSNSSSSISSSSNSNSSSSSSSGSYNGRQNTGSSWGRSSSNDSGGERRAPKASHAPAAYTLLDAVGGALTEGRERRYSQDSESSGGAPSAEVTDDESENEDGSTRKDRRRPRSARSQDSFVSDNSGNGLPSANGVVMGAEQLTPKPPRQKLSHRAKVSRRRFFDSFSSNANTTTGGGGGGDATPLSQPNFNASNAPFSGPAPNMIPNTLEPINRAAAASTAAAPVAVPPSAAAPPSAAKPSNAPAFATFPCIKGRPVGVTGHRFIHLHSFATRNDKFYHGFNLQFPKVFGLKTAKAKDMANLVRTRNEMLVTWAKENTRLNDDQIMDWVNEIDS